MRPLDEKSVSTSTINRWVQLLPDGYLVVIPRWAITVTTHIHGTLHEYNM